MLSSMTDDAGDNYCNDENCEHGSADADADAEDLVWPSPLATAAMSSTLDWLLVIIVLVKRIMMLIVMMKNMIVINIIIKIVLENQTN